MRVENLNEVEPFTTLDGSTIRGVAGPAIESASNQSLAEASVPPGGATTEHYHRTTEEIYFVLKGSGDLEVDGERRRLRPGDAALIPPGAWHTFENDGNSELRFLCCCAPPYSHDDTIFE